MAKMIKKQNITNVLLVNANYVSPPIPPVGLEYIAEYLLQLGKKVDLIDLALEENPLKSIKNILTIKSYDAIGISIRNLDSSVLQNPETFLPRYKALIEEIRSSTDSSVILGGAGFSILPQDVLRYLDADFGVRGCGIPAIKILLEKINSGRLPLKSIIECEPEEYLDFSFRRSLLDLNTYASKGAQIGVNTRSGCNQKCIYCTYPIISGRRIQLRNPERVLDELESIMQQGIEDIFFADSIFNIPSSYSEHLCNLILRRGLEFKWGAYFHPGKEYFHKEMIPVMKKAGLKLGHLGIDSGSQRILRIYKKGFVKSDIKRATDIFRENGLDVGYSILFGAPGEDKESIDETFELIDSLHPASAYIQTGIRVYGVNEIATLAHEKKLFSETRDLLNPVYYPFDLVNYVAEQVKKRDRCMIPNIT